MLVTLRVKRLETLGNLNMPFITQSRLCGVTPSLQHENDFIKLIQIGKETITAHPQCGKKKQ